MTDPSPTQVEIDALVERAQAHVKRMYEVADLALANETAEVFGALTDAIVSLQGELAAARNEASCCDDINLNQPLDGFISDLQRARAKAEAELAAMKAERDELREENDMINTGALEWLKRAKKAEADLSIARASQAEALSTDQPVAWGYRWKLDGEWTNWRVADHSQKSQHLPDLEEYPLYARKD